MSNNDKFLLGLRDFAYNPSREPKMPRTRRPRRPLPMLENKALGDLADFKMFLRSVDVLPVEKRGLVLEHIRSYMTDRKSIIDDELFYTIATTLSKISNLENEKHQTPNNRFSSGISTLRNLGSS